MGKVSPDRRIASWTSGNLRVKLAKGTETAIRLAIGLVLIVAAVLKAESPGAATASTQHVLAVGPGPAFAVVSLTIAIETILGCALLSNTRPRLVVPATTLLLLGFSVLLLMLAIDPQAPACACFGGVRLAEDARTSNLLGLGRNGIMLAGCAFLNARLWSSPSCRNGPVVQTPLERTAQ